MSVIIRQDHRNNTQMAIGVHRDYGGALRHRPISPAVQPPTCLARRAGVSNRGLAERSPGGRGQPVNSADENTIRRGLPRWPEWTQLQGVAGPAAQSACELPSSRSAPVMWRGSTTRWRHEKSSRPLRRGRPIVGGGQGPGRGVGRPGPVKHVLLAAVGHPRAWPPVPTRSTTRCLDAESEEALRRRGAGGPREWPTPGEAHPA